MLKTKALRKILVATASLFIIMTIYLIPTTEKTINTNLEFEYITNLANSSIYLLDSNNHLVKTKVLLDNDDLILDIKSIINNLTLNSNSKFSDNLQALIPLNTKLNEVRVEKDTVYLDFSKEFLTVKEELSLKLIESIVYSLTELDDINKVHISVNGTPLDYYPNTDKKLTLPLSRDIGINKKYCLTSLNDITKVVIYYNENIDNDIFYVPVTKYVNNDKDKIDIIVEELTTSYIYEDNLQSILNENLVLTDKEIVDGVFILDFNDYLFDGDSKLKEEVLYTISYSVFANYDINVINFKVNGESVSNVKRSDLL